MKKYAPYVLFGLVVLMLFWLGLRWYTMRSQTKLSSSQLGEGVNIENLSESEMRKALGTVADYETVTLQPVEPEVGTTAPAPEEVTGIIRYEIAGDKLKLGVVVTAPDQDESPLQVWIRKPGGTDVKPLFTLEKGKGGLVGSAQLDADLLPLEVLVSVGLGVPQDSIVLKGTISAPVPTDE